jgi:hypothetical protein
MFYQVIPILVEINDIIEWPQSLSKKGVSSKENPNHLSTVGVLSDTAFSDIALSDAADLFRFFSVFGFELNTELAESVNETILENHIHDGLRQRFRNDTYLLDLLFGFGLLCSL